MNDGYQKHSMARGAERFGLDIAVREYKALSAAIAFHELTASPEHVFLCKAAEGREKWAVWHKGEWIPLVFDPEQARIVTLLPPRELRYFRSKLPW